MYLELGKKVKEQQQTISNLWKIWCHLVIHVGIKVQLSPSGPSVNYSKEQFVIMLAFSACLSLKKQKFSDEKMACPE